MTDSPADGETSNSKYDVSYFSTRRDAQVYLASLALWVLIGRRARARGPPLMQYRCRSSTKSGCNWRATLSRNPRYFDQTVGSGGSREWIVKVSRRPHPSTCPNASASHTSAPSLARSEQQRRQRLPCVDRPLASTAGPSRPLSRGTPKSLQPGHPSAQTPPRYSKFRSPTTGRFLGSASATSSGRRSPNCANGTLQSIAVHSDPAADPVTQVEEQAEQDSVDILPVLLHLHNLRQESESVRLNTNPIHVINTLDLVESIDPPLHRRLSVQVASLTLSSATDFANHSTFKVPFAALPTTLVILSKAYCHAVVLDADERLSGTAASKFPTLFAADETSALFAIFELPPLAIGYRAVHCYVKATKGGGRPSEKGCNGSHMQLAILADQMPSNLAEVEKNGESRQDARSDVRWHPHCLAIWKAREQECPWKEVFRQQWEQALIVESRSTGTESRAQSTR